MSLTTKWNNPIWDANQLSAGNIMNYFCDRSNPFYNAQCNNEKMVMQRVATDITQLVGEEFILIHAQEPILFIILKQRRSSPTRTVPLAYYYIVSGEVMQAPDLASLINSRLQTTWFHMNESFQLLLKQVEHHPLNGTYSWKETETNKPDRSREYNSKEHNSDSVAERLRNYGNQFHTVNMNNLITDWVERFPPYQTGYNMPPMQPPMTSSNTVRTVSQTPSNGSCTPRSAAVSGSDIGGQPPNKKMRN